jgi:hypothetical protein
MNCEPGDLAIIVRSIYSNHGALVRGEDAKLADPGEWRVTTLSTIKACWIPCNSILVEIPPGSEAWIQDSDLKPLRDPGPEAIDETLIPFKEIA